jgi:hypothetical protein
MIPPFMSVLFEGTQETYKYYAPIVMQLKLMKMVKASRFDAVSLAHKPSDNFVEGSHTARCASQAPYGESWAALYRKAASRKGRSALLRRRGFLPIPERAGASAPRLVTASNPARTSSRYSLNHTEQGLRPLQYCRSRMEPSMFMAAQRRLSSSSLQQ